MQIIEDERLNWVRFQAEQVKRSMRRLRANPDFARQRAWVLDKLAVHQNQLANLLAEINRMETAC